MKIITVNGSATMRRIIKNGLKAIGYNDVIEAETLHQKMQQILGKA